MEIWYLRHSDINKSRWDRSIRQAVNGNIYAWSWYLDAVSPGWEALVNHDYSMIMPIPKRTRYGISYLFQPLLSQQLGVFCNRPPGNDEVIAFLERIPASIRWIHTTLNRMNPLASKDFKPAKHTTYELDLVLPYERIREKYSQNTIRNLKKAMAASLVYDHEVSLSEYLEFLRGDQSAGSRILLSPRNRQTFINLAGRMIENKAALLPGVRNPHGQLEAAVLMGFSHQRYYYLAPGLSPEGRNNRALFMLIDSFIREHSGMTGMFDFEGSDLPSLARFYQGFGGVPQSYLSLQISRFNWPLNYFLLLLRSNHTKKR